MQNFKTFKEISKETIEARRKRNINNICRYGLSILDGYLGGIVENELVVIGAGTGIGKTDLSSNIALYNAFRGKKVALLSLEGDVGEISYRYFQAEMNKKRATTQDPKFIKSTSYRLNLDDVTQEEDLVYKNIPKEMDNLFIFDKSFIPDRKKLLELMKNNYKNFDLFVIDHLHYMDFGDNEYSGVGDIIRGIKEMNELMQKPVIVVSHLNRQYVAQKRLPTIHDLHGTSNIEKNANTIILIAPGETNDFIDQRTDKKFLRPTKIIVGKSRTGVPVPAIFDTVYDLRLKSYRTEKDFNYISFDDNNRISEEDRIFG